MVIYELDNRGKRNFIIAREDFISGEGTILTDINKREVGVQLAPDTTFKVSEDCAKKLLTFKGEIKLVRKIVKKDKPAK